MKVLLVTTKYKHVDGSPWLVSELADEFVRAGHLVTVINLNWSSESGVKSEEIVSDNIRYINVPAYDFSFFKGAGVLLKWAFSSWRLIPVLFRIYRTNGKYDLVVSFSPCASIYCAVPFFSIIAHKSLLLYWDFFPIHNSEISNKITKNTLPILKAIERWLVNKNNIVGLMSDANLRFYNEYFGVKHAYKCKVIPIWTSVLSHHVDDTLVIRTKYGISCNSKVVVFGGQLTHGRGIEEICLATVLAAIELKDICLVVCGSGYLSDTVIGYESYHPKNIKYIGSLTRQDYLDLLVAADCGIVSTVSGVSSPTFPSKTLDYLACKLPVVLALEESSDFGRIAEDYNFGIKCAAGAVSEVAKCLIKILSDSSGSMVMGMNGNNYLRLNHSVESVVDTIVRNYEI